MNSELKRFDEDLKSDTALQEELKSCVKDKRGLVAFANVRGYTFTLEDLNGAAAELRPEDLDSVSGGAGFTFLVTHPTVAIVI